MWKTAIKKSIISEEKRLIVQMILLYCKKKHGSNMLCGECAALKAYAYQKLDDCRYGENKTACSKCPTQCYAGAYRKQTKEVMRFSGPRMLLRHPILVIRYMRRR